MLLLFLLFYFGIISPEFGKGESPVSYANEQVLIEKSLALCQPEDTSFLALSDKKNAVVDDRLLLKQIQWLEETVEESKHSLRHDEDLRRQIWNLGKSLQSLLEAKKVSYLRSRAIRVLDQAHKQYSVMQKRIRYNLQDLLDNNLLDKKLMLLAENPDAIARYAEEFEKSENLPPYKKYKAKCGPTARAIVHLYQREQSSSSLLLIDSERLDHVFLIQETPRGTYRILQSFVNSYSLAAQLAEGPEYSHQEIQEFLAKLSLLDQAETWNKETENIYCSLFHSLPNRQVRKEFSQKKPDLKYLPIRK